jgi:LPS export ABC transporter protein LptC
MSREVESVKRGIGEAEISENYSLISILKVSVQQTSPFHRFSHSLFKLSIYKFYIGLLFALILLMSGCSEEKIKPYVDPSLKEKVLPAQEGWNSKMNFTEDGELRAILFYDYMRMYDEKRETLLEGLKIDFYNKDETKSSTLTSKRGRVDDISKNMWAIDSVVAVNDSGVTLRTEELMWRNKDQKIVSDKFVTIVSRTEKIEGYGFESDQGIKNYVIHRITYVTAVKPGGENQK